MWQPHVTQELLYFVLLAKTGNDDSKEYSPPGDYPKAAKGAGCPEASVPQGTVPVGCHCHECQRKR
ncbi:MAG: hypothetical protein IJI14_19840 [Anaerolineaceae bacterium]|nr:hypothetical protein [Anaerolineaceae bacterium]